MFGEKFGEWQGILASTVAAGGMTVLLAGVLIWIERKIVQRVRVAAAEGATAAVEEGTRDLRENAAHLAQRLDEIDDQLKQRRDRRESQRAEILAELGERPSWDVLESVVREAADLNAVADREITAPLTEDVDVDAPRITVHLSNFARASEPPGFGFDDAEPVFYMTVSAGNKSAGVMWERDETPSGMLDALAAELTREGMNSTVSIVSASTVFRSLRTALEQAITTRKDASPWFTGRMIERLDDDWVVTDQGLESRSLHLVLRNPIRYPDLRPTTEPEPPVPEPPTGVPPDFWKVAVARTYHHAHIRRNRRALGPLGYR
ncbi:hypothetical protein [Gordonia hongkongensis]|uniref:hypothetical protein n=1 Tax=Gordonia hongkongensis TaxID=1701090 RepID=UPI001FF8A609|nr:hypothetical protein [Gordonia hongkongensis]UPG70754.1 hypothetical protein MVF96_23990 [Gordonia hongkongensis]